jgi:hypothetical protein
MSCTEIWKTIRTQHTFIRVSFTDKWKLISKLCRLGTLTIVGIISIEPYTRGPCMTVLPAVTTSRTSKVSIQELKTRDAAVTVHGTAVTLGAHLNFLTHTRELTLQPSLSGSTTRPVTRPRTQWVKRLPVWVKVCTYVVWVYNALLYMHCVYISCIYKRKKRLSHEH